MQAKANTAADRLVFVAPRSRDTDFVSPYLAMRVRAWLAENPTESQASLARAAQVSGAQISNLLDGSRGAGRKTLRGVASAIGTTWPDVEREAVEWARKNPDGARGARPSAVTASTGRSSRSTSARRAPLSRSGTAR